ncbi:hypothetical protein M899_2153 [Bacteriovorax sp. BSW11_IV]|uniref:hypothetical protein n=1 Tax=Bacteriovorax sp. BSW11_IV TaxID=1353529 RepID=UPI00038A5111|nr:hypothetical protein [Bacteriovorax sp. BSW11_IV]EQC47867.1 hypothetical protein M899_2153 [Bacteriovorax sp. BSW11_IV]
MKKLVLCLVLLSSVSFADDHDEKDGKKSFAEKKAMALSKIDARMGKLGELKSCIQSAADMEATKVCRQKHKASMDEMMPKRRGKKNKDK